jgi:hypothetical protein
MVFSKCKRDLTRLSRLNEAKLLGNIHNRSISAILAIFLLEPYNGKEATVNRALDGSTYPGQKRVLYVFGKIYYGGLKHNSLYLGLVLLSGR